MLLRNVLYKGDYLTQKTIRNANGTGRTKNRGEREQYYLEEHHTPLIPPEVFDHVQKLLESTALWENRRNVSPEQRALLEEEFARGVEHVEMHHGVQPPGAPVAFPAGGTSDYFARLVHQGQAFFQIVCWHIILINGRALREQERAVAVAEETEIVGEGIVVDAAPVVADQGGDEE